jgi:hypothetical protein
MITKLNIPCVWGGHLAGILLKNQTATTLKNTTKKIIGIHGWLDNLNSLLPLAEKMVDRHPSKSYYRSKGKNNYIYLAQTMKSVYTIVLVMVFPVIFRKVLIIPMVIIYEIFVPLHKVSFALSQYYLHYYLSQRLVGIKKIFLLLVIVMEHILPWQ